MFYTNLKHVKVVAVDSLPVLHYTILTLTLANRVMFSHSNNVNISGGEFNNVTVAKTPEELKIKNVQKGKHIFVHF